MKEPQEKYPPEKQQHVGVDYKPYIPSIGEWKELKHIENIFLNIPQNCQELTQKTKEEIKNVPQKLQKLEQETRVRIEHILQDLEERGQGIKVQIKSILQDVQELKQKTKVRIEHLPQDLQELRQKTKVRIEHLPQDLQEQKQKTELLLIRIQYGELTPVIRETYDALKAAVFCETGPLQTEKSNTDYPPFIETKAYQHTINFLFFLSAAADPIIYLYRFFFLEKTPDGEMFDSDFNLQTLMIRLGIIFGIDVALKIKTYGWRQYKQNIEARIDVLLNASMIPEYIPEDELDSMDSNEMRTLRLIMRVLRVVRGTGTHGNEIVKKLKANEMMFFVAMVIIIPLITDIGDKIESPKMAFSDLLFISLIYIGALAKNNSNEKAVTISKKIGENTIKDLVRQKSTSVGEQIDEELNESAQEKIEIKRKEGVVFFSDMAGFTKSTKGMNSEALWNFTKKYMKILTNNIIREKGHVLKFTGDGSIFYLEKDKKSPTSEDDICIQALKLAIDNFRITKDFGYMTRQGFFMGEFHYGTIGSEGAVEQDMAGRAIAVSSRIEMLCTYFGTWIMFGGKIAEVQHSGDDGLKNWLVRIGKIAPKGVGDPVDLYAVYQPGINCPEETNPQQLQVFIKAKNEAISIFHGEINTTTDEKPNFKLALEKLREANNLFRDITGTDKGKKDDLSTMRIIEYIYAHPVPSNTFSQEGIQFQDKDGDSTQIQLTPTATTFLHTLGIGSFLSDNPEDLEALVDRKWFNEGDIIIKEKDPSDCMYDLIEGEVEVYQGEGKNELPIITMNNAGDIFGEMSIIDDNIKHRKASVRATTNNVVVFRVSRENFIKLPEIIQDKIRKIAQEREVTNLFAKYKKKT